MRALPVALLVAVLLPPGASAQEPAPDRSRVFLDCPGFCDQTYIRTEITWVDWVLDREEADVHVLITSQATGGGGRSYELAFIGVGAEEGHDHQLTHTVSSDATQDVAREGLTRVLAIGLTAYVGGTEILSRLRVVHQPPSTTEDAPAPTADPWDYWVFNLGLSTFLNGESSTSSENVSGSLGANRVTEDWKLRFSARYSYQGLRFELPDTTVEESLEEWGAGSTIARSIGDRWSVGVLLSAGSDYRDNQELQWSIRPGVEYNVFPYAETSRRSLTTRYLIGPQYRRYEFETIFFQTSETRVTHSLETELSLVQPWGQWSTSVRGSQYLHDTSKYSVTVFGSVNLRLFQGFSVQAFANYSWIRDQIYLPITNPSEEQILLRQRQLATSFRYLTQIGIQYRFGSIFNNVVNTRFGF